MKSRGDHASELPSDSGNIFCPYQCIGSGKRDDYSLPRCHKNLTISNRIHHNSRQLVFKDGVALGYDDPEIEKSGPPDWKAEIERDTVVQPAPGIARFAYLPGSPDGHRVELLAGRV